MQNLNITKKTDKNLSSENQSPKMLSSHLKI